MDAPNILLVDDDQELTGLMAEFFTQNGFQLQAIHNGPDGLREAVSGRYGLLLLDVMMPGFDGFELLRRLRVESAMPVIMLTARTEQQSRILGLESGADDYLPKPFDPMELLARVRAVLRRSGENQKSGALNISGVRLQPSARQAYIDGNSADLTTAEYDILELLMRSAGRVVSRDELSQRLYGRDASPFDRSIDVHISHLRRKLNNNYELIRTVRGVGYQFAVSDGNHG